jgi:2-oxoglutarate ferredoxin oxidoreductase subunit alpha
MRIRRRAARWTLDRVAHASRAGGHDASALGVARRLRDHRALPKLSHKRRHGAGDGAHAGEGYKFHITGLTHDERGYPNMTPQTQDKLVKRLQNKIRVAADRICLFEQDGLESADVVLVSYGITSRVAQRAIDMAHERGLKVGKLRLITAWPFPDGKIVELAARVKAFVVPELNLGKMVREIERAAAGKAKTIAVPHAGGGVHNPEEILNAIVEASRC